MFPPAAPLAIGAAQQQHPDVLARAGATLSRTLGGSRVAGHVRVNWTAIASVLEAAVLVGPVAMW